MTEQQLSEGWQMVKFGDIAKHISKRVEPSETDLEIYVGLEHLDPDSLKIKRHGVPSDVEGQKLLVKKGQIIFGKRRAYQRKVAVAEWDCICSAHAMVLEANPERIIPEFLSFFMQSRVFMDRAVEISEGSLSPTIKWKILAAQRFKIPPKDLQRKLINSLIKISESLYLTNSLLDSSETLLSALEFELLNGEGKTGWTELPFKDLVSKYMDYRGRTPKKLGMEWGKGNITALSANNVKHGYIDFDIECHEGDEELYKKWMTSGPTEKGDILLTMEAPMGNVAQLPDDKKYILSQRVILIRPKREINKDYLFCLLKAKFFQHKLQAFSTGTTAKGIKRANLDKIKVWIPTLAEKQYEISQALIGVRESTHKILTRQNKLLKLYFALLNSEYQKAS